MSKLDTKSMLAGSLISMEFLILMEQYRHDDISVKNVVSSVEKELGVKDIMIVSPSLILGNMYIVFNMLHERYAKNMNKNQYKLLTGKFENILKNKYFQKWSESLHESLYEYNTVYFIRRMRNAISHLNFEEIEGSKIRVWDRNPRKNSTASEFNEEFTVKQLMDLYEIMLRLLAALSTEGEVAFQKICK